jgi:hypothetical protein
MNGLTPLEMLAIAWGAVTAVLLALVIYRTVVGFHEESQIFLDRAEAALAQEQVVTLKRINSLDHYIKGIGLLSGVLLLVMAAIWLYVGFYGPTTAG